MKNIILIVIASLSINCWAENPGSKIKEPIAFGITDKEDGWILQRSGTSVSLKKKGESDDENKEIEGYIIRLDAPVEPISGYVEQIKKMFNKVMLRIQDSKSMHWRRWLIPINLDASDSTLYWKIQNLCAQ